MTMARSDRRSFFAPDFAPPATRKQPIIGVLLARYVARFKFGSVCNTLLLQVKSGGRLARFVAFYFLPVSRKISQKAGKPDGLFL
jgi:hypothetical protein